MLPITRAAFTNGSSPFKYVEPFGADVFLSTDPEDVASTLGSGFAAATMLPSNTKLSIAFDGDAVVFSDEAEQVYQQKGLIEFAKHEVKEAKKPLPGGPFRNMLSALHRIQSEFPQGESPIRTAIITARQQGHCESARQHVPTGHVPHGVSNIK